MIRPLLLTSLAAVACGGCVVVPLPPHPLEGVDASRVIGKADARNRQLVVGKATRGQVRERLGPPDAASKVSGQWHYAWTARTGLVLSPIPPFANVLGSYGQIWLNFDQNDLLVAFEIVDDGVVGPGMGSISFFRAGRGNPFVHDDVDSGEPTTTPTTQPHARPPLPVP